MKYKKRIRKLERRLDWTDHVIDIILSGNKTKMAMIYAARKVVNELNDQILKGDGKDT